MLLSVATSRSLRLAAAGLAVGGAAVVAGPTLPAAQAASGPNMHCPSGAVCLYRTGKLAANMYPDDVFYSYGPHNISNYVGMEYISNHQTGHYADVVAYSGSGGTGRALWKEGNVPNGYAPHDMTPVNSVVLKRPS